MAARKPFLLRTEPEVLAALQRWAADELRSVNGQIDFVLRRALQQAGRLPARAGEAESAPPALGRRRAARGGGSAGQPGDGGESARDGDD
ncbi:MAG: hypothetical protein OXH69_19195 [Acidobacteria bacterium]|nr:hypothetical protein [Acidobacteriota bacterium]